MHTNKSGKQFALSVGFLTVGVGLMLVGISWLIFLGLIFVVLSDSAASDRKPSSTFLLICLAGVVLGLSRGSSAFSRTPTEWWYTIILIAIWLWGVISGFRKWQTDRRPEL